MFNGIGYLEPKLSTRWRETTLSGSYMASQAQDLLVGTRVKDTAEKQLRIKESPPWRLWLLNIWIDLRDKEQA